MFEFKNIENIDTDLLTAFVVNHEYGNIFQTSDYYNVHKNQQGTTPFGFAVTENQQIATHHFQSQDLFFPPSPDDPWESLCCRIYVFLPEKVHLHPS